MSYARLFLCCLFALLLSGCGETSQSRPPMQFTEAVVEARLGEQDISRSPVSGGYSIDGGEEQTREYATTATLAGGDVRVEVRFVGESEYQTGSPSDYETHRGDVYLVNVIRREDEAVQQPVLFKGEQITAYEQGDLTVTIYGEDPA